MKSLNKIFIALGLILSMSFVSCVDDLNVDPKDPNVKTDVSADMERVLAECYQAIATSGYNGAGTSIISGGDAGANSFTRAVFVCNELTTDHFAWKQFGDAGQYELATMQFAADNGVMYTTYSRIYTVIAVCNEFIRSIDNGKFTLDTDELKAKAAEYKRQAKVIRGLCYFYAIDMFGNCGYQDETMPAGTAPAQYNRADLYNKVVEGLEAVSAEWGESYVAPSYGYVGKEACDALLAKFYLNAEVFTGTPAYDKCWNICEKIIAHHQGAGFDNSGLAESYLAVFGANNHEYMSQGSRVNEIIWGIPQDGIKLQNYGGSTFFVAAATSTSTPGCTMGDYNLPSSAWTCMNAREQLSRRFDFGVDVRGSLWCKEDAGFTITNDDITNFANGYGFVKYTNWAYTADGQVDALNSPDGSSAFCDADWCVIRLAEIYLTAAEANIVGKAGDQTKALQYVNYVRNRAGISSWTAADLTADNILDERSRELYGENCRRTDLVRHNKYAGGNYNWNWKGNVGAGGTSTPEHMNVFPIPSTVISFQGYKQNAGY